MIISRTPFRVSFAGGGTDLPSYYMHEDGAVLSTTIDKFIYVTVKKQNELEAHRIRVSYSKTEHVQWAKEIENPIVREALQLLGIDMALEISMIADIPAKTGLGSSSSFAVGMLQALHALKEELWTPERIAEEACTIELEKLQRPIGKQDHWAAAVGGLNLIQFMQDGSVLVDKVLCKKRTLDEVFGSLQLFYTGITRDAASVLRKQREVTHAKLHVLRKMKQLAFDLKAVLEGDGGAEDVGRILHEGWMAKRSISDDISSSQIDDYYKKARAAGAWGGKLLGAGGGGFLLLATSPENQQSVSTALSDLKQLPFRYEPQGSKIVYITEHTF